MKYFALFIVFSFAFVCKGQDTAKHSQRNSISVGAGINVMYPTLKPYNYQAQSAGLNDYYYSNYQVTLKEKITPWSSFSFSHIFYNKNSCSFGFRLVFGYAQYAYAAQANGYDYDFGAFASYPGRDSGIINVEQKISRFEFGGGLFMNTRISGKISLHNEVDIIGSSVINVDRETDTSTLFYKIANYYPAISTYSNIFRETNFQKAGYFELDINYQVGMSFSMNNHLSITPFIVLPVIDYSMQYPYPYLLYQRYSWSFVFLGHQQPFNYLTAGIFLGYSLD